MSNSRSRPRGGPTRRLVLGSLLGALLGGSALGLVIGVIAPAQPVPVKAAAVQPSAAATDAAAPVPSSTSSPTLSASVRTITLSPDSALGLTAAPWKDPSLQLTTLVDVRRDRRALLVQLEPAQLLTGNQARDYYAASGQGSPDYAVVADGTSAVEYQINADTVIYGQYRLGRTRPGQAHRLSVAEFFTAVRRALDQGQKPVLWLRTAQSGSSVVYFGT